MRPAEPSYGLRGTPHTLRLLHHTALAALFATFGVGHLQE